MNERSFIQCPTHYQQQKKAYSFATDYDKHIKYTTPHNYLHKCMMFKVVYQNNTIGSTNPFAKANFIIYI